MAELKIVLRRINEKGYIKFEIPQEIELQEALRNVLKLCRDKYNDFVSLTFKPPYKPRSTGEHSQNHHLNGHIMQICNETGNSFNAVKLAVKQIAMEQFGYPFETVGKHIVPKSESDSDTVECNMLIEASHYLAAEEGIILREEAE